MPAAKIKLEPALVRRHEKQLKRRRAKKQMSCRILIVSEGEKTEPNYFKAFKTVSNYSFDYEVIPEGCGKNTIDVVKRAIELRDKAVDQPYDAVWAVFDKDSFSAGRFNSAIIMANDNSINVAWSNEAFELWYLLHFHNRVTAMGREEYKKAISKSVTSSPKWKKKVPYVYKKNAIDNYEIMNKYGSQADAIRNAESLHNSQHTAKYDQQNPCTTVYQLVIQLLNKDEDLIAKVMRKIYPDNHI